MNSGIVLKNYRIKIYKKENKENCSYYINTNNKNIELCKNGEIRLFKDITEKILKKNKKLKKLSKFDLANFIF